MRYERPIVLATIARNQVGNLAALTGSGRPAQLAPVLLLEAVAMLEELAP